jgi:DNA-binding transcriptional regulator YiaG
MSAANFHVMREFLKLPQNVLAELLGVERAEIVEWESGASQPPEAVLFRYKEIADLTLFSVNENVRRLNNGSDDTMETYRSDADFWAVHPDMRPYPASWQRGVVGRVAEQVPGLSIGYNRKDEAPFSEERMTSAELRVVRELLGLSIDDLARLLHVDVELVSRWESGVAEIPTPIRLAVEDLETEAANEVTQRIDALNDARDVGIVVFRTDEDLHLAMPGVSKFPATWHRAIVARAFQEVFELRIEFWDRNLPGAFG